jgi:hypothetical protein
MSFVIITLSSMMSAAWWPMNISELRQLIGVSAHSIYSQQNFSALAQVSLSLSLRADEEDGQQFCGRVDPAV